MGVGLQRGRLRETFRMMEFFCSQFVAGVIETYIFVKTHGLYTKNKKRNHFYFMLISKAYKLLYQKANCTVLF